MLLYLLTHIFFYLPVIIFFVLELMVGALFLFHLTVRSGYADLWVFLIDWDFEFFWATEHVDIPFTNIKK
tara:strand:+ start:1614 stop:1823 length:210 start_codon:yes stop_codon:yes gene_type:complete